MIARAAALLGAGAGAAWSLPALAPLVPALAQALGVPRRRDGASGIALTFDDGPHPEGTPAVLDLLSAAGAKATF
ncbi:MAG: polysaccharide deacetylase family protein, partial [Solirubrobacterales bacterium]|nr:polysaccharide deacetylase family protein [Solirubrobacterales bacterium]